MVLENFYTIRVRNFFINTLNLGINPKTGEIMQLPPDEMKKIKKPKLYFDHK